MTLSSGQRVALFLVGCMGSRAMLVYLAATVPLTWLKFMGALAALVALGFTAIYLGGLRPTGPETGGQPIWWDNLRPVHAALYAAFAYYAWVGDRRMAWTALAVDAAIGLASYTAHAFT